MNADIPGVASLGPFRYFKESLVADSDIVMDVDLFSEILIVRVDFYGAAIGNPGAHVVFDAVTTIPTGPQPGYCKKPVQSWM
jgi:hypothetical protein